MTDGGTEARKGTCLLPAEQHRAVGPVSGTPVAARRAAVSRLGPWAAGMRRAQFLGLEFPGGCFLHD